MSSEIRRLGNSPSEIDNCDCCISGVDTVCEVYFAFYILLISLMAIALLNYRNVRKRSMQPVLLH